MPEDESRSPKEATIATDPPGNPASMARYSSRWGELGIALALPVLFFLVVPPLSKSGLWDPYELNIADLSRRIALHLYQAGSLALDGADNTLPHLNDLGRPQLPFSSIALGFKLFGLHEWAGRLPLALWGVVGALATYAFAARLFDRRTGVYSVVALCTMPVYLVQARMMLGDVCTMAALALSFGGLCVAAFDRGPQGPTRLVERLPWLGMGIVGLLVGFESRGGLLGLGVPLLAVGLAWLVARLATASRTRDGAGDAVGAGALVIGGLVAAMAVRAIAGPDAKDLNLWVGAMFHTPAKYPTFEFTIGSVGHALAPWSAFVPFAFGRMLFVPSSREGQAGERESLARGAVLLGAAVALLAHGYMAARTESMAFSGACFCAVACAVAIRDYERGAWPSIAVGVGTVVLAALLHHDFHEMPDKAYQAFGIVGATFPESFKATALNLWWIVLGGFAVIAFFAWVERDSERAPFEPKNYASVLRELRDAYDGVLAFVYFIVVAGACLAGLVFFVGARAHASWLPQVSSSIRDTMLNLWWIVAFVPLGAVFGALFATDVWLWTFSRSEPWSMASFSRGFQPFEALIRSLQLGFGRLGKRAHPAKEEEESSAFDAFEWFVGLLIVAPFLFLAVPILAAVAWHSAGYSLTVALLMALPCGIAFFIFAGALGDMLRVRAIGFAVGSVVVGFVLCFFYYPALANQLSPKEVFESYRRFCPNAPLGLLGVGGRTSAYYAGGQPQTLTDAPSAFTWLSASGGGEGGERRCLAMKAEELPKLNQLWRERAAEPKTNLPVLDARSSQILLAASSLEPAEKNANPLGAIVLARAPRPQRPLHVNMDDKLEVLGIDLVDERGRLVDVVSPGRPYRFKTYYKVLAPVGTEWEGFIHIDGYHRRHNGDHKVTNNKYPMALWLPGDIILDDHEFKLEPNFSPGNYSIYFGLFTGDTRLKIKTGPNDGDNRIDGGPLRVQ
jgi:4-amino-4-deoxy-L-arabinose transferase-like glycosyltransferase